ncbi:MAG: LamG domain-containing protein, partial [Nanoarchaeota archaeon]
CGNYDADSCLEWSGVTACSTGQVCSGGNCVAPGQNKLLAHYRFENDYSDSSGNNNHGSGLDGTLFTEGKGKAVQFDGIASKVSAPTNLISGTGDFSISLWIYRSVNQVSHYIFGNYGSGDNNGIEFFVTRNDKLSLYISSTSVNDIIEGKTKLNANNWYHVAATRKNGIATLYVNGVEDGSKLFNHAIVSNLKFTVGNAPNYNQEAFKGKIDEVKVWNYALNEQEIKNENNLGNCNNECSTAGTKQCSATGVPQICAVDGDSDSCFEWKNLNACASGQSCSIGKCVDSAQLSLSTLKDIYEIDEQIKLTGLPEISFHLPTQNMIDPLVAQQLSYEGYIIEFESNSVILKREELKLEEKNDIFLNQKLNEYKKILEEEHKKIKDNIFSVLAKNP